MGYGEEPRRYWGRKLSRRAVLRSGLRLGMGIAGLSLVGCAAAPAVTPTPGKAPVGATPTPAARVTPTAAPTAGGTLIVRGNSTQGFDPDNATGGADAYRFPNVYNSLTAVDPVGKSIPELAESWETPDPTTVVLKLKKGVKFHDGTDFNAQAVKFNYDRTLHPDQIGYPKFKSKAAQHLVAVKSYEVVDDYTFKIILKGPSGSFLYVGTGGQMASDAPGWMVSPAGVKKLDNDLLKQGVGTGPFEFVEWLMDERVSVKKFPGYWEKGIPYLDGIKWLVIPDSTTAMTMLKSGEVMWDNWFDFKDLETIKADPNLNLVLIPTAGTVTLTLNQKKPPFNNTALRQAVWYAIDRDAITKVVYKGTRPPAEAWFPSTSWAYDASLKGYPVDLDKARAKLKEGGKPDGFEFTIKIASAFPDWVQAAEIMQAMLAKVNIKTKVELVERAAMSTQRAEGNFEAESVGWSGDVEPAADLLGIHSKKSARGPFVLDGEDPVTKQVDALMDKGDSTFNLEERKAAYKEVQKLMLDQAYHRLILTYETSRHAHHKKVKGYVQYPGRFFSSYRPVWIQK